MPVYTVALGTSEGVIETPGGLLPVPPDPETMREIARVSGGQAFTAEDENRLDEVYKQLGSRIGSKPEQREITAGFAAGGLVLLLGAAGPRAARHAGGSREHLRDTTALDRRPPASRARTGPLRGPGATARRARRRPGRREARRRPPALGGLASRRRARWRGR